MAILNKDQTIENIQSYLTYFVVAHIPAYALICIVMGIPLIATLILQTILCSLIIAGKFLYNRNPDLALDLSALSLTMTPAVLVYTFAGHEWQLDAHMYFFAALAMTIGFKSIRATLLATTAIALHHLILNYALPYAVFPDGSDLTRVIFHALIVIFETAIIILTIRNLCKNDARILQETEFAQNALTEAKAAKVKQEEAEKKSKAERSITMHQIAEDFDAQVGSLILSLSSASSKLQDTATDMRGIAEKTTQNSESVATSSEEASANVNTVAAAMEEMSATASEISMQVNNVKDKSKDMAHNADSASKTVSILDQLAENIGEVVTSIRDIAEQTNLLALNATIEAARAGEAGKGFAVVADEVKKLASETANKTSEIESRISEIQSATKDSVYAVEEIIKNIGEIDGAVTGVSAAIEEQNITTKEVTRSVTEASAGVSNVSKIIMDVQNSAVETRQSSDIVLTSASEVATLSDNLQNSVRTLIQKMEFEAENLDQDELQTNSEVDENDNDILPIAAE